MRDAFERRFWIVFAQRPRSAAHCYEAFRRGLKAVRLVYGSLKTPGPGRSSDRICSACRPVWRIV